MKTDPFTFKGIRIYEVIIPCTDCEKGDPTHNSFHFPHTSMEWVINDEIPPEGRLIEEWTEEEIEEERGELSWTQFAISRCNFHKS